MSTLTDFLLARIAEDERRLDLPEFIEEDSARGPGWGNRGECPVCGAYQFSGTEPVTEEAWWEHAETVHQRARVLAECKVKRRIVEACTHERDNWVTVRPGVRENRPVREVGDEDDTAADVLQALALPYVDHPDYAEATR